MKKTGKSREEKSDPEVHIMTGKIHNSKMANLSAERDASADRQRFLQDPSLNEFERPATIRELLALGYPTGTKVHVVRGQMGSQFRIYLLPTREGVFDHSVGSN